VPNAPSSSQPPRPFSLPRGPPIRSGSGLRLSEIRRRGGRCTLSMNKASKIDLLLRRLRPFVFPSGTGQASRATIAIRGAVGAVFIASGTVKFLYDNQGPGRFAKIGFPHPESLAHFVGAVEIVAGALLVLGLFTRIATIPLVVDMVVALATTKVPLLFGAGPEPVAAMPKTGFWAFVYQARLDATMLVASGYLMAIGAGLWSIDAWLAGRRRSAVLVVRRPGDDAKSAPLTVA
jgi:putative oxidoreductase